MVPFDVNTTEFQTSREYHDVVDYIFQIKNQRGAKLAEAYPDYRIKPRCYHTPQTLFYHLNKHNVPFFDIIIDSMLHRDGSGYLELSNFAYQLDCFSKNIFHRKIWAETINDHHDMFLDFVWDDWERNQHNGEFDSLQCIARKIFNECDTLAEYHKKFVYNTEYNFITELDVKCMFDELVEMGIFLGKEGGLYRVFDGIGYEDAETDMKSKIHSGQLTRLDGLYIRSKFKVEILPKLLSTKSKFSFIPIHSDMSQFDEAVIMAKMNNKVWLIPQFLVFYS